MSDLYNGGAEALTADEEAEFAAMAGADDAPVEQLPEVAEPDAPVVEEPAAAAEPEIDPAAAAAAEADKPARDDKGKFVPHGALHEERERRKSVEQENIRFREQIAALGERQRIMAEAMAPRQPVAQAKEIPDPTKDIFGYIEHLKGEIEGLKTGQQETVQQAREREETNHVVSAYQADASRFAAQEPTFNDAYRYLIENRTQELTVNGFTSEQIAQSLEADEMQLVKACLGQRQSPAARMFQMAQLRGFRPAAPAAAAPDPAATAAASAERLANIAKGQASAKSLSSAGGAAAGEVTAAALAAMSDAEFAAFEAKNPKALARLMGASE